MIPLSQSQAGKGASRDGGVATVPADSAPWRAGVELQLPPVPVKSPVFAGSRYGCYCLSG